MPRRNKDLISAYLQYTENTESPTSYHLWSFMSILSSTMARRCYMQWGHSTIYPNQYIVLIGPSGRARKGEPISIARDIVEELGLNIVAESIIREALIRRIKNSVGEYLDENQKLRMQCPVVVVAEELAVFLGENNTKLLADLTNLYDARKTWKYETKHAGTDEIVGVCFNILGSMAPDWIPVTIPHGAIGGGFTSRIIFIVEHHKAKTITNPNLTTPEEVARQTSLRASILADLEQINQVAGEFTFSPAALDTYEQWYERSEQETDAGRPPLKDKRFTGYVSRRATHLKKLSMACSIARDNRLIIEQQDFERAKAFLKDAEINMEDVFGRVGRADYTVQIQDVIDLVKKQQNIDRADVLRMFYRDIDDIMLRQIEATLESMRLIKIQRIGSVTKYQWID